MNEVTKTKITSLFEKLENILSYFYSRWQDEKEYEDFQDYVDGVKKSFEKVVKEVPMKNAVFVSMTKRPFKIVFDFEGWKVSFIVTAKEYKWKATKIE